MVKPIMRDVLFLGQKSIPATEEDLQAAREPLCGCGFRLCLV